MSVDTRDRAEVLRDIARDLLAQADEIDGDDKCVCGHTRRSHGATGWNRGWCDGSDPESADPCECEEFDLW
jgi:hypothetical protein